jgi:hypothetical protein
MARITFDIVDIIEILVHWHAGRNNTEIAASLGVDRKTVRKYAAAAQAAGDPSQWVTEKSPTRAMLGLLAADEQNLANDTFGPAVRLEQEPVSLTSLEHAL